MKFRVARHTVRLQPLIDFYCGLLDMELIGEFHDHDGYDGVMIGNHGSNWHLEFTCNGQRPTHVPDQDDLLVFYPESEAVYVHLTEKLRIGGVIETEPTNPYWKQHGKTYIDPDGFRIVLSTLHT